MGKTECDGCAHKTAESRDAEGKRTVNCDANPRQMFQPYADDCKKWEPRR